MGFYSITFLFLQLPGGQRLYETAVIHTSLGDISLKLFPKECPKTVENFCVHAKNGYYNGHIFHRVIKQFMIQTGDPLGKIGCFIFEIFFTSRRYCHGYYSEWQSMSNLNLICKQVQELVERASGEGNLKMNFTHHFAMIDLIHLVWPMQAQILMDHSSLLLLFLQ